MNSIQRITGVLQLAKKVVLPEGYRLAFDGTDFAPGLVGTGPLAWNETTVCLLPGDEGDWFIKQVEEAGEHYKRY